MAFEALVTDRRRVLGPDHRDTLRARSNLAYWYGMAGDLTSAGAALTNLIPDLARVLGPDHPDTTHARSNLAHLRAGTEYVTPACAGSARTRDGTRRRSRRSDDHTTSATIQIDEVTAVRIAMSMEVRDVQGDLGLAYPAIRPPNGRPPQYPQVLGHHPLGQLTARLRRSWPPPWTG